MRFVLRSNILLNKPLSEMYITFSTYVSCKVNVTQQSYSRRTTCSVDFENPISSESSNSPSVIYEACPESKDTNVLNMYITFNLQKRRSE